MADNDLVLRIPHTLGAAEAKRRLAAGVDQARIQYGQYFSATETGWDNDLMNFRLTALSQTVRGTVRVESDFVELRAQLPLLIRLLAKRFVPIVSGTGTKLLT